MANAAPRNGPGHSKQRSFRPQPDGKYLFTMNADPLTETMARSRGQSDADRHRALREPAAAWFAQLRDRICAAFEAIEDDYPTGAALPFAELPAGRFERTSWQRPDAEAGEGGGGTLAVMNNLHVPVGLLLNLLIWNQHEPLGRLALGGLVILGAVWISRLGVRRAVSSPS